MRTYIGISNEIGGTSRVRMSPVRIIWAPRNRCLASAYAAGAPRSNEKMVVSPATTTVCHRYDGNLLLTPVDSVCPWFSSSLGTVMPRTPLKLCNVGLKIHFGGSSKIASGVFTEDVKTQTIGMR